MFSNSHLSNTLWRTFHAPPNYIRRINTKKNRYIIYILSTKKIGWWVKGHTNHYLLRFLTFSFVKKSKTKRICYIYIIVHRKYWPYFYSLVIIQKKHSKQRIIFCLVKTWFRRHFGSRAPRCSKIFLSLFFIDGIARIVSTEFCLCWLLTPPVLIPVFVQLQFGTRAYQTPMQEDIYFLSTH